MTDDRVEIRKSAPVVADVDVLVVGSGIAGSGAAVTAAREGARTMVVDRFGCPGGNMGPGMFGGAPDLELPPVFRDGLPGVPGEFVRRCEELTNATLLNHYFRDSQVVSYVWLKMMEEAGVETLWNTWAGDPLMEGNRVTGLLVENKSGTQAIRAKVVIDATGDADVAMRAGATMDEGASYFSPGTYFALANVHLPEYVALWDREPTDEEIQWIESLTPSVASRARLLKPLIPYCRAAWESGEYRFLQSVGDEGHLLCDHGIFRCICGQQYREDVFLKGEYGIVGAMVGLIRKKAPTSGDAQLMSRLETAARKFIFKTALFLRRRVPGFQESYLHIIAPYFNTRGGRSFVADYTLTPEDATSGRRHDDAIFHVFRHRVRPGPPQAIEYLEGYDFPYRQLLPKGVEGLLGAGRACIIQPPVTRVRWMVMLMGQAAGVAAALAARAGVTPRAINVPELRDILADKYGVPLDPAGA